MDPRPHDIALGLARAALAIALLPSGIARALNVSGFAVTLAGTGMPYPNAVASVLVVVNVFGPLALLAGIMPRLTGGTLAGFSLVTTLLLHRFWESAAGSAVRSGEEALFVAGLGLCGGFLLYAIAGPGAWSWQGIWHRSETASARPAPAKSAAAKPRAAGARKAPAARQRKAA